MMSQKSLKNLGKSMFSGKNKFVLVGMLIAVFVLYIIVGPLNLLTIYGSYSNAYEGAKPSIAGIKYNGTKYTSDNSNPYFSNKGMTFSFKGDGPTSQFSGLPKIDGEMTSVFIPQNTKPGDLPSSWRIGGVTITNPFTSNFNLINNPYDTDSWNVTDIRGNTNLYSMEEWKTKFYVSISADPDGSQVPFANSQWDQNNGRYSAVDVWFKLDTTPTWYFEGTEKTYFAIAEIEVSDISYRGHNPDGAVQASHNDQLVKVNPSSPASGMMLFLNNFGENSTSQITPEQIYSYKGVNLNPQYFGNAVYFCITLDSFGSQSWGTPYIDWKAQGDVVTFDFTITQFVVGEWKVQNIMNLPDGYGRGSSYSESGIAANLGALVDGLFSNPLLNIFAFGIIVIVILVLLAVFAPGVLSLLSSAARVGAKKISGKKGAK
jgi:hypothetical protein